MKIHTSIKTRAINGVCLSLGISFLLASTSQNAFSQLNAVASESRDAATAYLGTANFVVGRIGRDCLPSLGRTETPQAFVSTWQQRNAKYVMASDKYLQARLAEAQANGGSSKQQSIIFEFTSAVRAGAEATLKAWLLDKPDLLVACTQAVATIESGTYDVSQTSPIFSELEALAKWAE
jgi:hypothetical protein